MCPKYMCILLYVKLMWCSGIPQIYGQLEEGPWSMCILLYVRLKWCSGILQIYGQLEGAYICPKFMCILLYVNLMQCAGISQIYGQLEEDTQVYVHSAICEIYLVQWYLMDQWLIGGGYMCPKYKGFLLYVKLLWCSGILQINGQLEGV